MQITGCTMYMYHLTSTQNKRFLIVTSWEVARGKERETSTAIHIGSEDFFGGILFLAGVFVWITSPLQVQIIEGIFLWNLKLQNDHSFLNVIVTYWTLSIWQKVPVFNSENFMSQSEQYFPFALIFQNIRTTLPGITKISQLSSQKFLFHSLSLPEFPEFSVEWFGNSTVFGFFGNFPSTFPYN